MLSSILIITLFWAFSLSQRKISRELESIMVKSSSRPFWVRRSFLELLLIITYFGRIVIIFVYRDWLISIILERKITDEGKSGGVD